MTGNGFHFKQGRWSLILLCGFVAFSFAFRAFLAVEYKEKGMHDSLAAMNALMAGQMGSPLQERAANHVPIYWTVRALNDSGLMTGFVSLQATMLAARFFSSFAALLFLGLFVRDAAGERPAFIAVLIAGISYQNAVSEFFMWDLSSLNEAALIALALWLASKNRYCPLLAIGVLSGFVRETAPLNLAMVLLAVGGLTKGKEALALLLTGWLIRFGLIQWLWGGNPRYWSLARILDFNLHEGGWWAAPFLFSVFGPLWILFFVRKRKERFGALPLAALPYVGLIAVFGIWSEIRLWIPMAILLAPYLALRISPGETPG